MTDDTNDDAAAEAAAKMQIDMMQEMILKLVTSMLAPAFQKLGMKQLLLPHAFAMCARTEAIMCATMSAKGEMTPPDVYKTYMMDFETIFDLPIEAAVEEVKRCMATGQVHFLDPDENTGVTVLRGEDSQLLGKVIKGMQDGKLMDVAIEIAKGGEAAGAVVQAALAQHKGPGKG